MALVDGKVYSVEEALKVADLPSKEQLVAMLLSTMLAPVTGLARVCAAPAEGLARTIQAYRRPEGCIAPRLLCICKVA